MGIWVQDQTMVADWAALWNYTAHIMGVSRMGSTKIQQLSVPSVESYKDSIKISMSMRVFACFLGLS